MIDPSRTFTSGQGKPTNLPTPPEGAGVTRPWKDGPIVSYKPLSASREEFFIRAEASGISPDDVAGSLSRAYFDAGCETPYLRLQEVLEWFEAEADRYPLSVPLRLVAEGYRRILEGCEKGVATAGNN